MADSMRRDVSVYNEATSFLITSQGLAGRDCNYESGSREWNERVQEGVFLPFSLVSDNGPAFRVLVNEGLSEREEEEWVTHFAWKLLVPDGKLALIDGSEYLWGNPSEDFMKIVRIPPDQYRADIYTCFYSINGPDLYWGNYEIDAGKPGSTVAKESGGPLLSEPVAAWFRRTRPGKKFPGWLVEQCCEDPRCDPGYEDYWYNFDEDEIEEEDYIDFIVKLTPLAKAEPLPVAFPQLECGWIPVEFNYRLPEKCPRGLKFKR